MSLKQEQDSKLALIPKSERYIEYMLEIMIKLPRIEKFSIGTEYKQSMYQMLSEIMILNKIKNKSNQEAMKILDILNRIDSKLNTQRIYLRIRENIRRTYKILCQKQLEIYILNI